MPFAAVVLAHLKAMETKHDPESRRRWKLRIVKGLFQRDWSQERVRQLFRLIDWIIALPDQLEKAFQIELHRFGEENKVEYMSSIERVGYKKGLEVGTEKGMLDFIGETLAAKFGTPGLKLMPKVRKLNVDSELRNFVKFLTTAGTIKEVRDYLS